MPASCIQVFGSLRQWANESFPSYMIKLENFFGSLLSNLEICGSKNSFIVGWGIDKLLLCSIFFIVKGNTQLICVGLDHPCIEKQKRMKCILDIPLGNMRWRINDFISKLDGISLFLGIIAYYGKWWKALKVYVFIYKSIGNSSLSTLLCTEFLLRPITLGSFTSPTSNFYTGRRDLKLQEGALIEILCTD